MSEWLKEHAWKACVGETLPWVRIPLSPPSLNAPNINHLPDRVILVLELSLVPRRGRASTKSPESARAKSATIVSLTLREKMEDRPEARASMAIGRLNVVRSTVPLRRQRD